MPPALRPIILRGMETKSVLELRAGPLTMIFDPSKPAKYPNGRSFTDDVIDHRLAFLSKGDIPPTGLRPHTDVLREFPYLGTPHQQKS